MFSFDIDLPNILTGPVCRYRIRRTEGLRRSHDRQLLQLIRYPIRQCLHCKPDDLGRLVHDAKLPVYLGSSCRVGLVELDLGLSPFTTSFSPSSVDIYTLQVSRTMVVCT
jgi:hypothetical protein